MSRILLSVLAILPFLLPFPVNPNLLQAKYIILLVGDGYGANQLNAANIYTGEIPSYQSWTSYWVTTYPSGGSYDSTAAWTTIPYVTQNPTDSAAAATALSSGVKTANGRINVSSDGQSRLTTIVEEARLSGLSTGGVTSVYISHATPGGWLAHNDSRTNGYAIADEALWGNPNTTGSIDDPYYGGGHGSTLPAVDVLIGAGHPDWDGGSYVNQAIKTKLIVESGQPGKFSFIQRSAGFPGGSRLLSIADNPAVTRLVGLFGGMEGNLEYRLADGSGASSENPTLAQMTKAALTVLNRDPDGFVLMVEGGAIDKAAHANAMDEMIGEVIDFNNAIQTVIDWVDDPSNNSTWQSTLVIVTADHETGYLAASPGGFPNQPLGEVSPRTLFLEKIQSDRGMRASWEDTNVDNKINFGETVYWAWNSANHTNSLVRIFVKGAGEVEFFHYAIGVDPVRGYYLDNTDIFKVMHSALFGFIPRLIQKFYTPLLVSY